MNLNAPEYLAEHLASLPSRVRLVTGAGSLQQLGELARAMGVERAVLVTDQGLCKAGHAGTAVKLLRDAGIHVRLFDQVCSNPTTDDVMRCQAFAAENQFDTFIAIGGGSVIDTAKGTNFLLTNGGKMDDYRGLHKNKFSLLPMIAIPTTAGTGSEAQSFAVVIDAKSQKKMACGDPSALPCGVILDPLLTITLPRHVTAFSGMDTLVHVVESAVTTRRNRCSIPLSHHAFALVLKHFPIVCSDPQNLQSRDQMLHAAFLGGMAIEQSMLGAAHATANPLTTVHRIVHGHAVSIMLPHIIRFNAQDAVIQAAYRDLAVAGGLCDATTTPSRAVESLLDCIVKFMRMTEMETAISKLGVTCDEIPELAKQASEQWTGRFNPIPLSPNDFRQMYLNAM